MAHLEASILIHAPMEEVYALARDPTRWPIWFDGMGEIKELTGEGEVGTVVKFNFMMTGTSFPVTITVLEDHTGPEGAHWKAKFEGPLTGEHNWTYVPKNGATETTAEIDYELPGAVLGKIADRLIVERMHQRSLELSLENLKLLCEAG